MNKPMIRPTEGDEEEAKLARTEEQEDSGHPVPSWFPKHDNDDTEELLERYRAHNGRVARGDGPPSPARRQRPVMPREETVARQRYYRQFPHEADEVAILSRRRSMAGVYAMAGLLAMFAGGATGMVFAHLDDITSRASSMMASFSSNAPGGAPTATAGGETVIQKKLVATATLDVSDVSGGLNKFIPLMLHAEPAFNGSDIALKVSGLPKDAYLTAGSKAPDDSWMLKLEDAAEVKLVVPKADQKSYDVSVAAIESDSGELAAPIKEMKLAIDSPEPTIIPASAEPEAKTNQIATASPLLPKAKPVATPDAALDLLAKGDTLLASGDMTAARQFYERAFTLGAARGAFGAGKTYDPVIYKAQNVQGLVPDPVQAMEWYMRAANAGDQEAIAAIQTLKTASR
jgi:hypothetical protein